MADRMSLGSSAGLRNDRIDQVRAEWLAITRTDPIDPARFAQVKAEADALVEAGRWVSGPSDMLSVIGRQRDELVHSAMLAWLAVPTNRHGLGRTFVTRVVDHLWPGESLMRTGVITASREEHGVGVDEDGHTREAIADLVIRCEGVTIVVENKVGAGEQPDQCERLYWAWAGEPGDTRWVFLTPTGRPPVTAISDAASAAWRTLSYPQLRAILAHALLPDAAGASVGRATATQYLETLLRTIRA